MKRAACLCLLLQACAADRGSGFATLEEATLEASLTLDDGELITAEGYTISVEQASVRVTELELQQAHDGAGEPSSGACHGDHCHGEEAAVEEHEPVEQAAGFEPLVRLGFDAPLSLTAGRAVPADGYDPSPTLGRSEPSRVLLLLRRFELEGSVTGGDLAEEAVELAVDLPLELELEASFTPVVIDRDGPEHVHLETQLILPSTLFDGIDLGSLDAGRLTLDEPEDARAGKVAAALAASQVRARLH